MTTVTTTSLPNEVDVLIIGAGAAGLMCASVASKRERSVLVVDHANKVGKKTIIVDLNVCKF